MESNAKVEIESTVNATVTINMPEFRINRTWTHKGAKQIIPFENLNEALYHNGVRNFFLDGTLYIHDMDTKIALGLEPENAKEPENIIVLTPSQQKRYLTAAPLHELKAILEKIPREQARELANFAVEIKITDMSKAELLKAVTGFDVIQAIRLNAEA